MGLESTDICKSGLSELPADCSTNMKPKVKFTRFAAVLISVQILLASRVFHEHTELTKMTILASQALLRETQKNFTTSAILI